MPLAEVVFGYHDRLKTLSRGYASLDTARRIPRADLVRLDVLVNGGRSTRSRSSSTATPPTTAGWR
jgi:GTP-binding protein LepA